MRNFIKPTVLISECIEGNPCRYDGSIAKSNFVKQLKCHVNFITVCPETYIGLSTPRETLRITLSEDGSKRLVFSKTGEDITAEMERFSVEFIKELSSKEIHGVILKGRSPSCGIKDVKTYKSFGKSPSIPKKTSGIFAEKVLEGFNQTIIEDEGRLINDKIREHFLTRIFTVADFQEIKKMKSMKELVKFHSDNKYLFMAYSPANLKALGKVVANHEKRNIEDVLNEYEYYLNKALSSMTSPMRNVNMLLHLFGYFSKELLKDEKAFFLDILESYRNKIIPFSVPLKIMHGWVIRFNNEYLLNQTIFQTFPESLIEKIDLDSI